MITSFVLLLLLLRANLIEKDETKISIKEQKRASKIPKSSTGQSKEPSSTANKQLIKNVFEKKQITLEKKTAIFLKSVPLLLIIDLKLRVLENNQKYLIINISY